MKYSILILSIFIGFCLAKPARKPVRLNFSEKNFSEEEFFEEEEDVLLTPKNILLEEPDEEWTTNERPIRPVVTEGPIPSLPVSTEYTFAEPLGHDVEEEPEYE